MVDGAGMVGDVRSECLDANSGWNGSAGVSDGLRMGEERGVSVEDW